MEKGRIRAEHFASDINRVHDLDWGSDFSKLELEKVDELIYTADYGRLAVGKVDRIEGSSDFANIRIGAKSTNFRRFWFDPYPKISCSNAKL